MKNAALCAVLACASMACAANQPNTLAAAPSSAAPPAAAEPAAAIAAEPAPVAASVASESWLGAAGASELVLAGGGDQFVGVWVDVPKTVDRVHVPMMLTLTIDTSGSMAGDKIREAREAARTLVSQLHDGDMVAIHAFSDLSRELVGPTALDAVSRQRILGTIAELRADGATNVHDALELSIRRARSAPSTHPVRRVVMISDGQATVGPTSLHTLGALAEAGTRFGVQVTALGVGLDYDENTLNELAVRSSGRLYHLADAREMPGIIRSELRLLQSTMATDAFVEVVPAPGVRLVGSGGVRSEWGQNGAMRFPLGTMFAGQRRELLVRYRLVDDNLEGRRPIASARLVFSDSSDGGVQRVQEVVVRGELTDDAELVQARNNPDVQAILAVHQAATLAQSARAHIDSDRFDEADSKLAKAEAQLRQSAREATDARAKQRILQAAEGMARTRSSVASAKAAPPKARPAAKRASALDANDAAMEAMGY